VKLVAELEPGLTTEVEVARLERDEQAGLADLGLRLAEAKQLTAALQAEMVPAQVTVVGERRRSCEACGGVLTSKGHYTATFRSLFGDVPVRVRRLLACPCQGSGEAKSFAVLDLEAATVAPELAYVTARYAALAPFGKVAALLSELLPISGAQNAGTVRNRTLRVGEAVVQTHPAKTAKPTREHAKLWGSLRCCCGCLVVVGGAKAGIAPAEGISERVVQRGLGKSVGIGAQEPKIPARGWRPLQPNPSSPIGPTDRHKIK